MWVLYDVDELICMKDYQSLIKLYKRLRFNKMLKQVVRPKSEEIVPLRNEIGMMEVEGVSVSVDVYVVRCLGKNGIKWFVTNEKTDAHNYVRRFITSQTMIDRFIKDGITYDVINEQDIAMYKYEHKYKCGTSMPVFKKSKRKHDQVSSLINVVPTILPTIQYTGVSSHSNNE